MCVILSANERLISFALFFVTSALTQNFTVLEKIRLRSSLWEAEKIRITTAPGVHCLFAFKCHAMLQAIITTAFSEQPLLFIV